MAEQPVNIEAVEQLAMIDQRPVPGQSLTNNAETPLPFEGPPQTARLTEALHGVFEELIEEENYMGIMDVINDDIPISDIVQMILFDGFSKGMWNPDLMLILIEPLMYLVMALADKAGIDYVLYPDEEDDEASDPEVQVQMLEKMINETKNRDKALTGVEIPLDIKTKLEDIEFPEYTPKEERNLLDQNNLGNEESLLDRGIQ